VTRVRRARLLAGLLLALAVVASGCARSSTGSSSTPSVPPVGRNDINVIDRNRLPPGGTLRWPIDAMPANFNQYELDGTNLDTAAVMLALMPAVFDFDAAAQPILKKEYASSAELTATDPAQVITYEINPQARWDDGTPITEADFEAQWKALNGTNAAFNVATTEGYDKIARVARGKDDREVVVTMKEKYADWRAMFTPLFPASTNGDPKAFNGGWIQRPLVTGGPFRFDSIDQTAKTITVARNDRWWGPRARLDRIIFRAIDPDAQIDSLANGEIDFIDVGPNVNNLRRAEATRGVTLRKAGGPNFRHLTMNGTSEVLQDVNVRHALALAINRQTIARALLGPLGVPAGPLNNHIFMTNQKGYQSNAGDLATADPARAGQLLDQTGWKMGPGGIRTRNGKQLDIRLVIPSQVAQAQQESELVQGMLKSVGVKVDIRSVPVGDFFDKYITPGDYDFTVFAWIGTPFPISSTKSIYAKPKPGPNGQLAIQQNYARVGSDDLDRLFDQATAEFDPNKSMQLGNQIDARIWQEVHSLTLYQRPEIVAARSGLANFGAFGFATTIYQDIGFNGA
jgi:peptide/nickel transport system substrate-binding protein